MCSSSSSSSSKHDFNGSPLKSVRSPHGLNTVRQLPSDCSFRHVTCNLAGVCLEVGVRYRACCVLSAFADSTRVHRQGLFLCATCHSGPPVTW